jgi:transposase
MMKKRYFMGIDVAKTSFDFSVLSTQSALLWRGHWDNEPQAIEAFIAQLRTRGWKFSHLHVGLESSGVYGTKLLAALHAAGLAVSVLNPAQVKFFAISVLRRTKNDRVDAGIIARFCLERKPPSTRPLRWVEEQLKLLVHERESRVAEQTRERNRAKKDLFQIQLPSLICRQRQDRLKQLQNEIRQLDSATNELIANDEYLSTQCRLLCSIPGIAQTTAAKLLSELAGKEFHSARQLAAYAGLNSLRV